jgi:hypothetical protein
MPAIPTKVKLPIGKCVNPIVFKVLEKKKPAYEPKNREGAKLPPFPPLHNVIPVAKTLSIIVNPIKTINAQVLFLKSLNRVFSNNFPGSFSDKVRMLS